MASKSSGDRIFLTFDIEWAHDEVLSYCLDLCEQADIKATFFATHNTPVLERIRKNPNFELGIHPNFNSLFDGCDQSASAKSILSRLQEIVPEAKVIRSHSLTQSSRLLVLFREHGFTHDANTFIPYTSGIELKAWSDWRGIIRVPHCWEDDIYLQDRPSWEPYQILTRPGLKVFDFHPIHLFLNTEHMDRYEAARPAFNDPQTLRKHRNSGPGIYLFFERLLALTQREDFQTAKLSDIKPY